MKCSGICTRLTSFVVLRARKRAVKFFFGQMTRELCLVGVLMAVTGVGLRAEPGTTAGLEGAHAKSLPLLDDVYNNLVVAVSGDPAENVSELLENLIVSEHFIN